MAIYLVKAKPVESKLDELRRKLARGDVRAFEPFGRALDRSLRGARLGEDGIAMWEEVDYCSPPLREERAAVLDEHFTDISVEPVDEGEGWSSIGHLTRLFPHLDKTAG